RPLSTTLRREQVHHPRGERHRPGLRSEEHTSELQSRLQLVCRLLLEKKKMNHERDALRDLDIEHRPRRAPALHVVIVRHRQRAPGQHHFIAFFFFTDPATTEIYTLSLHDALPLYLEAPPVRPQAAADALARQHVADLVGLDRKSTRLNSSHGYISYAVFCLKK